VSRRNHWLILGILFLALILRLVFIQSRGIWYDDAFSFFLSEKSLPAIVKGTAADTMPPLYYFLLHFWMIISQRLWWLRSLNILLSLGIVIIEYAWISSLMGPSSGRWAAFLTAISSFQIYYAQELRMYTLLVFCQLCYIRFFWYIWRTEDKQSKGYYPAWLGVLFFGTLAMYSHNLAIFGLVVPDVFLIVKRKWKFLSKLLVAQLIIGVLSLPWLGLVPGQIAKIQRAFWTPQPGIVQIIQALIEFTGSLPLPYLLMGIVLLLSVEILAILILESTKEKILKDEVIFLAIVTLIPPVLLLIVSYMMRPVFVPRGFYISLLAYSGLAGWVISKSWLRGIGTFVAGSFVLAALVSLPYQMTFTEFPRSPYQKGMEYIASVIQPGDTIVHDNKLSFFPSLYYSRFIPVSLPQVFVADTPGSHNDTLAPGSQEVMQLFPKPSIQTSVDGQKRVYFIVFSQAIQEYQQLGEPDHPSLAWLESQFHLVKREVFNDLEIYQFERK